MQLYFHEHFITLSLSVAVVSLVYCVKQDSTNHQISHNFW